jgi:lipopolysaccharide/colanic/teichoic acid biosynthesis glycosyltransferase
MGIQKGRIDKTRQSTGKVVDIRPAPKRNLIISEQSQSFNAAPKHILSHGRSENNWLFRLSILVLDSLLINIGFLCSFLIRYGWPFPEWNFIPYKNSFLALTLIHLSSLAFLGTYRIHFRSSWVLFARVAQGQFLATLVSIVYIYIFRIKLGSFPSTIFIISFFVNLLLTFKFNQFVLKSCGRIKKKVVVIGEGDIDNVAIKKATVERCSIDKIQDIARHADIDEIIICGNIPNEKDMSMITYLAQKMKIVIVFSPACYVKLLSEMINGNGFIHSPVTFIGRKRDTAEFLMRYLDVLGSLVILLFSSPFIFITAILIKLTSKGPVIYCQQRVGKDGNVFTLYKFRTMLHNAEELSGFLPATDNDPRITKIGKWLRQTRLDELPQLFNILRGDMSLVGPRPENLYRVDQHKALQGLRLAVKPGLTGLAQIRSFYDLHPKHKIKYDYLYIQRRSLLLNLYILAKTIPVVLSKKGC